MYAIEFQITLHFIALHCTEFLIIFQLIFALFSFINERIQKQQIAQTYLLIMQRILERDIDFIGAERSRLQKVLDGKISNQKRKEINEKLNILSAFDLIERAEPHTEL